jgi:5-methyltetrahydrofolate--homocysteine methyltransferase
MEYINDIYKAVLEGDATTARARVEEALKADIAADQIMQQGLIAPMTEIGRLFETGECFIPEMLIAARAMQSGLGYLKPFLIEIGTKAVGRAVIGTVQGDLHDIGKNIVGMMLEGAGFEIIDLGVDVPADKFIKVIQAGNVDIIGLSALLTTTMVNMKVIIEALKAAGIRDKVKVIIGGAPVTEVFARQIGADGYAPDASSAARLAKTLIAR